MENKLKSINKKLVDKASLKQDVYSITRDVYGDLKSVLEEIYADIKPKVSAADARIALELNNAGVCESYLTMGGDTLIFHMHTNVFTFPESHMVHKSGYVSKNPSNAYCGVINIYNFLTDSFKFNRLNDLGYMVGRIFVNRERHFFVEGKKQLGFLFNDFTTAILDKKSLRQIVETTIEHVLAFDLYTPPYDKVNILTLDEVQQLSQNLKLKTGKRLGFRFESEGNEIDF